MPRFHKTTVVATAAAALVLVAQAAWASDVLDRDIYLRLGAGFSAFDDANFFDRDCDPGEPAALFGCGNGADGERRGSYGDFDTALLIEIGGGVQVNDWLKTESP